MNCRNKQHEVGLQLQSMGNKNELEFENVVFVRRRMLEMKKTD